MTTIHAPVLDHYVACEACRNGEPLGFDFTMAFQPIADIRDRTVFAYEALVRGIDADPVRQVVVRGLLATCRELGVEVVAEGIETVGEYE